MINGAGYHILLRNKKEIMSVKIFIIKSLLTSLCLREVLTPSLEKRGWGRFFEWSSAWI
ncbi:MAG: hypothetical protein HZA17_09910 [Nitrospirae bacterium]|nr:hypothetical protein [Nitrospirota bacterium]